MMEQKEASGIYIRAQRDGKWDAYDITDLTKDELHIALKGKSTEELINWVAALARLMRDREVGNNVLPFAPPARADND